MSEPITYAHGPSASGRLCLCGRSWPCLLAELREQLAAAISARVRAEDARDEYKRQAVLNGQRRDMEHELLLAERQAADDFVAQVAERTAERDALRATLAERDQQLGALKDGLSNTVRELAAWHAERPCVPAMQPVCVSCGYIEEGRALLAPPAGDGAG